MEVILFRGWTNFHENTGLVYSDNLQRLSNGLLKLLDANAKALSYSELGIVINQLDSYWKNDIREPDLIQTIEHQIDVGRNRLHNKKHHAQRRGQLDIGGVKELVAKMVQTITRIEKYDYKDADFYEIRDSLLDLELMVEWLQELVKNKDAFAPVLQDRDLNALDRYLSGLSEQELNDLIRRRMEENDRYTPLAINRVYPKPKGTD